MDLTDILGFNLAEFIKKTPEDVGEMVDILEAFLFTAASANEIQEVHEVSKERLEEVTTVFKIDVERRAKALELRSEYLAKVAEANEVRAKAEEEFVNSLAFGTRVYLKIEERIAGE